MVTARVTGFVRENGGRYGVDVNMEPCGHDYNRPLVRLEIGSRSVEVDAEHFYRAAAAMWQGLRPLGKADV